MIHFNEIAGTEEEGLYWDLFKDMFNLEKEAKAMRDHIRIGTRKSALPYGRLNILVQSYNVCTQTLRSKLVHF